MFVAGLGLDQIAYLAGAKGCQSSGELRHGGVALLYPTLEQEFAMWIELGVASAALRSGGQVAGGPIRCQEPHHKRDRDLEVPGCAWQECPASTKRATHWRRSSG